MATVNTLVVGGGASGGAGAGGGGGAGGYQANASFTVTPQAYSIVVGTGGAAQTGTNVAGNDGNASTFSTITGNGGGGGGYYEGNNGRNGGSGGGGGGSAGPAGGTGGTGSQGSNGGNGAISGSYPTGGGGGASAAGATGSGTTAGNGGAGTANSISGSSVTYAGGGGGGLEVAGTQGMGGAGGGGNGRNGASGGQTAGTDGLGGGGGGANNGNGQAGGKGVVIISFPTNGSTGVDTSSTGGTITTSGGNQIHTFTGATELFSTSLYSDSDLIAYYRLEDATDSEDSGTDYDLTNTGSVAFAATKFNNGADFTGANSLNNNSVLGATSYPRSFSGWSIFDSVTTSDRTIFALGDGSVHYYAFKVRSSDSHIVFRSNNTTDAGDVDTGIVATTATMYQWVVIQNSATSVDIWINGTKTNTAAATFTATVSQFYLGYLGRSSVWYMDGRTDDVAIFNRALTDTEARLLNAGGTWTMVAYTAPTARGHLALMGVA